MDEWSEAQIRYVADLVPAGARAGAAVLAGVGFGGLPAAPRCGPIRPMGLQSLQPVSGC